MAVSRIHYRDEATGFCRAFQPDTILLWTSDPMQVTCLLWVVFQMWR